MIRDIIPEPTARSAVPGVSPRPGLLIPLLAELKVDNEDEIFSVRWSLLILILWRTITSNLAKKVSDMSRMTALFTNCRSAAKRF